MYSYFIKCKRIMFLKLANLFSGTHFFSIKRTLLNLAGLPVGDGTRIVGPLHIGTVASFCVGKNTWIGHDLFVEGNGSVEIGDNVDIAAHVVFSTGGHDIGAAERRAAAGKVFSQKVCNGTWIGIRSTVVNNVVIGMSCVVAAGSVVVNDIESNTLVGGVPAKFIRTL